MTWGEKIPRLLELPEYAAIAAAPYVEGEPPDASATAGALRPDVAADLAAARAIRTCPHRARPACGCPERASTCGRPDQAGRPVFWADCMACVRGAIKGPG